MNIVYRTTRHDNKHWDLEKFITSGHYTGWAVIMCNCQLETKEAINEQSIESLRLSDMSVATATQGLPSVRLLQGD